MWNSACLCRTWGRLGTLVPLYHGGVRCMRDPWDLATYLHIAIVVISSRVRSASWVLIRKGKKVRVALHSVANHRRFISQSCRMAVPSQPKHALPLSPSLSPPLSKSLLVQNDDNLFYHLQPLGGFSKVWSKVDSAPITHTSIVCGKMRQPDACELLVCSDRYFLCIPLEKKSHCGLSFRCGCLFSSSWGQSGPCVTSMRLILRGSRY